MIIIDNNFFIFAYINTRARTCVCMYVLFQRIKHISERSIKCFSIKRNDYVRDIALLLLLVQYTCYITDIIVNDSLI